MTDSYHDAHNSFADYLLLCMSATDKIPKLLHSMQSFINDSKDLTTTNMLKLNDNNTELMFVTLQYNSPS